MTATGTLQQTNQVDVSSELSGTVRNVAVDFNSEVSAVFAELDTDKLRAAVAASRAKLSSARAKVGIAKATLIEMTLVHDRKVALAAKNVGSDQDVDTAKAAIAEHTRESAYVWLHCIGTTGAFDALPSLSSNWRER